MLAVDERNGGSIDEEVDRDGVCDSCEALLLSRCQGKNWGKDRIFVSKQKEALS
jgi:hypothetical protein